MRQRSVPISLHASLIQHVGVPVTHREPFHAVCRPGISARDTLVPCAEFDCAECGLSSNSMYEHLPQNFPP
jgi:hypothetical protein